MDADISVVNNGRTVWDTQGGGGGHVQILNVIACFLGKTFFLSHGSSTIQAYLTRKGGSGSSPPKYLTLRLDLSEQSEYWYRLGIWLKSTNRLKYFGQLQSRLTLTYRIRDWATGIRGSGDQVVYSLLTARGHHCTYWLHVGLTVPTDYTWASLCLLTTRGPHFGYWLHVGLTLPTYYTWDSLRLLTTREPHCAY